MKEISLQEAWNVIAEELDRIYREKGNFYFGISPWSNPADALESEYKFSLYTMDEEKDFFKYRVLAVADKERFKKSLI